MLKCSVFSFRKHCDWYKDSIGVLVVLPPAKGIGLSIFLSFNIVDLEMERSYQFRLMYLLGIKFLR